jgi:hypothetical protein
MLEAKPIFRVSQDCVTSSRAPLLRKYLIQNLRRLSRASPPARLHTAGLAL